VIVAARQTPASRTDPIAMACGKYSLHLVRR
jgi:hypothetical protein